MGRLELFYHWASRMLQGAFLNGVLLWGVLICATIVLWQVDFYAVRDRYEHILRDISKERYGQTMNQTREGLMEREKALPKTARSKALAAAESIGALISEGPTQPFYKAYDAAANALASELNITQSGAKALMKDSFKEADGRDLYEAGKEIEEAYHKPVREAEIAARKAEKLPSKSKGQSRTQSMS